MSSNYFHHFLDYQEIQIHQYPKSETRLSIFVARVKNISSGVPCMTVLIFKFLKNHPPLMNQIKIFLLKHRVYMIKSHETFVAIRVEGLVAKMRCLHEPAWSINPKAIYPQLQPKSQYVLNLQEKLLDKMTVEK